MGSNNINGNTTTNNINNNGHGTSTSGNSCCDMTLKCWCRWRWDHSFVSSTFLFFLLSFVVFGLIASLYAWLTFSPYQQRQHPQLGCEADSEGSWAIGVYYGDSPFNLKPIESRNVRRNDTAAWPVANPVVTCTSLSDAGYPSNFVADPFIYQQVCTELGFKPISVSSGYGRKH